MNQYGPPPSGAAFPRNGPRPFRAPLQPFPRGNPPLPFRPLISSRGPPPPFVFRGPPPVFQGRGVLPVIHGPRPGITTRLPLGLPLPSSMMPLSGYQTSLSPANVGPLLLPGWNEFRSSQGATYYHNTATGVSTYEKPSQVETERIPPKWVEYKDEATGAFYYFNTVTKETVWDQPEGFRMQKAREQVANMTTEAVQTTSYPLQVQTPPLLVQDSEQNSGVSTEQNENNDEEMRRQETQEKARKKRKEEQEREQSAQFENIQFAERMTAFKQFLEDKQILPTIKWSDAQRLIGKDSSMHNDPRWKFALNTVGEKKQAFAEYCTQAKNRATIEKRRLVKKTREEFIELLGLFESNLASPSRRRQVAWEELATSNDYYALRKDPRWSAVEEVRERQQLFATFLQDLERNQKARLARQRDAMRRAFIDLLRQRVDSKKLEIGVSRTSKRLDTDTKRRVLDLLEEVKLSDSLDKVGKDALWIVHRHDVYEWAEEFLHERRELEHAKRKREHANRVERQEKLSHEWNERFNEYVAAQKLTAGSTWEEFSAEYLKQASEEQVREIMSEADGSTEAGGDDGESEARDDKHLHWKAQRRIFETYTRRLRKNLEPVALRIRKYLDRSGDPPLHVTESTPYAVFINALKNGVSMALDSKAPEEGEEEVREETRDAMKSTSDNADHGIAAGKTEDDKKVKSDEVDAALETAVKKQRAMEDNDATVEFPMFVRQVYEMWVAVDQDERRKEKEKCQHRKQSHKESRNILAIEDDGDDNQQLGRPHHRLFTAKELESDENHTKRRSHRSSKKRHRSHGSPSISRSKSRSRSESRRESSRHKRSRRRSSRSRERKTALRPSSTPVSLKPVIENMTAITLSSLQPSLQPFSEAEEAAHAEEIIRQARLKWQEKSKIKHADNELEEGEEREEGEEVNE